MAWNTHGAKNATALLSVLVKRLRQSWPHTKIIVRGDSGFYRPRLMRWCERNAVGYVLGLARNPRLQASVEMVELALADQYHATKVKQREIGEFTYAADTWEKSHRVITRLEYGAQGTNPRFVVTNLTLDAAELYDTLYCKRGEAQNRIKEVQLDLFGTRASCHKFLANQFRILLAALAYTLMQQLRTLALQSTELANACAAAQDRGCDHSQHPSHSAHVRKSPPVTRVVRNCGCAPWRAKPLISSECCPRYDDKQRG